MRAILVSRARRLVAVKDALLSPCAVSLSKIAACCGSVSRPALHLPQQVGPPHDDLATCATTTMFFSCMRFRLMVTHCRVAPTMCARSAWVKAAPIRMPSGSLTP